MFEDSWRAVIRRKLVARLAELEAEKQSIQAELDKTGDVDISIMFGDVTRVMIAGSEGKLLERYGITVDAHLQDNKRTLKIWLKSE